MEVRIEETNNFVKLEPINGVCRFCSEDSDLHCFLPSNQTQDNENYCEMISNCFNIEIHSEHIGPGNDLICGNCAARLREACEFKSLIEDTENRLRRTQGKSPEESNDDEISVYEEFNPIKVEPMDISSSDTDDRSYEERQKSPRKAREEMIISYDEPCNIILSQRGSNKICARGYTLRLDRHRDDIYNWRCSKRDSTRCKGRVTTCCVNGQHYIQRYADHNHPAPPNGIAVEIAINRIKELARTTDKPSKELASMEDVDPEIRPFMPSREAIIRLICRARQRLRRLENKNPEDDNSLSDRENSDRSDDEWPERKKRGRSFNQDEITLDEPCDVMMTRRGSSKICARGYTLRLDRHRDNLYNWRCCRRDSSKCKGRVLTYCVDGQHYIQRFIDHNHPTQPKALLVEIAINQIKELARNTDQPSKEIALMKDIDPEIRPFMPSREAILRLICRVRQRLRRLENNQDPKTEDDNVDESSAMDDISLSDPDYSPTDDKSDDEWPEQKKKTRGFNPDEITLDEPCDIIESLRRFGKICARGYMLRFDKQHTNNMFNWRCCRRDSIKCKGRVLTYFHEGQHYVQKFIDHNHPIQPKAIFVELAINRIKELAKDTDQPIQEIALMKDVDPEVRPFMPSKEKIVRLVRRIRLQAKNPINITEESTQSKVEEIPVCEVTLIKDEPINDSMSDGENSDQCDEEPESKRKRRNSVPEALSFDEPCDFLTSQRGSSKISARGYTLRLDRKRDDIFNWRCCRRDTTKCKGRATTYCQDGQHYIQRFLEHNHSPEPYAISVELAVNRIKELARNTDQSSKELVSLQDIDPEIRPFMPSRESLLRLIRRTRQLTKITETKPDDPTLDTSTFVQPMIVESTTVDEQSKPIKDTITEITYDEPCELFTAHNGKNKICARGYKLRFVRSSDCLYYWRCTKKTKVVGCRGRAVTYCEDAMHYIQRFTEHTHPPQPNLLSIELAIHRIKELALTTSLQTREIIQMEESANGEFQSFMPSKDSLSKLIQRIRKKKIQAETDDQTVDASANNEITETKADDISTFVQPLIVESTTIDEQPKPIKDTITEITYDEPCELFTAHDGRNKICARGYKLRFVRSSERLYYWRCTKKLKVVGCRGRAVTYCEDTTHYIQRFTEHTHSPQPNLLSVELAIHRIKELALTTSLQTREIIQMEESANGEFQSFMPSKDSLSKLIQRIRKKKIQAETDDQTADASANNEITETKPDDISTFVQPLIVESTTIDEQSKPIKDTITEITYDEPCELFTALDGKNKICARGYKLRFVRSSERLYYWRCTKKMKVVGCRGRAVTYCEDTTHYIQRFTEHTHSPQPNLLSIELAIRRIKELAMTTTLQTREIIQMEESANGKFQSFMPSKDSLSKLIQRIRKKKIQAETNNQNGDASADSESTRE